MKALLLILTLLVSLPGEAEVYPITIKQGFIITEAQIDGQTVLVILDTGAPGLVLNQKYYAGNQQSVIPCTGIYGDFECKSHVVKRWEWLGINSRNTTALVSDLSFLEKTLQKEIHALVGLSALLHYYVGIDYDLQIIRIDKEMQDIPQTTFSRFQYVNHLPVITCKVNGQKKVLGLDTGSECNFMFRYTPLADDNQLASTSPIIIVGTDNKENLKHKMMMDLQMLEQEATYSSEFIVDLHDDSEEPHLSFDGMLGQPFLTQYNIIIHPGKQRLLLQPRNPSDEFIAVVVQ